MTTLHDLDADGADRGSGVDGLPPALALSPGQFWGIFTMGWVAFTGLTFGGYVLQGEPVLEAWIAACAFNLAPLAPPAFLLAYWRKRILVPRATLLGYIGHKLLVGVGFSAAVTLLGGTIILLSPRTPRSELGSEPAELAMVLMVSAFFFYALLLGFFVWEDSLERVQESRALAAREAVLRAEAEAKAVRAQFNPHFVFNTLHSLMLLVRHEPDTAERAIEDVAELIRYASTIQRREIDQVSLDEELEFARRYLALEKLRLADRLQVDIDVDETLLPVLVPAFSLQTLVENAIKHGISPRPEGGTLRISAGKDTTHLQLTVRDDGVGADNGSMANGGSGLALLRRRLEMIYGPDSGLHWEGAPGAGFTAALRIPIRVAAAAEASAP